MLFLRELVDRLVDAVLFPFRLARLLLGIAALLFTIGNADRLAADIRRGARLVEDTARTLTDPR